MNLGPQDMMALLRNDGIEGILLKPMFPTDNGGMVSQAEVLADVINIYRMDAKKFAQLHGVDISIKKVTAERVAYMLSNMVEGDPVAIIEAFNGIEDLHNEVFREVLSDEEFEAYEEQKHSELYSWTAEPADEDPAPVPVDSPGGLNGDGAPDSLRDFVASADEDQDARHDEQQDTNEPAGD